MQFIIIRPATTDVEVVQCPDLLAAEKLAGLEGVDHGTVTRGLAIVVYEYGLFDAESAFFALGRKMYAGNAVLYAFDDGGETIDIVRGNVPIITWMPTKESAEAAIRHGICDRPRIAVGDNVIWQWPQKEGGFLR